MWRVLFVYLRIIRENGTYINVFKGLKKLGTILNLTRINYLLKLDETKNLMDLQIYILKKQITYKT